MPRIRHTSTHVIKLYLRHASETTQSLILKALRSDKRQKTLSQKAWTVNILLMRDFKTLSSHSGVADDTRFLGCVAVSIGIAGLLDTKAKALRSLFSEDAVFSVR